MNQMKLKNDIQKLCNGAIHGADVELENKAYTKEEVLHIVKELRFDQVFLVAEMLRIKSFEDDDDNDRDDAVRKVKRAWFVEGENPAYHQREKFRLYKSWRPLHDAIERLANY